MAVQFECPSCHNPIEIDDPWAGRTVACPYCRNTVLAPSESTYHPAEALVTARAVDPAAPAGGLSAATGVSANRIAIWGFAISCFSVAVLVVGAMILGGRIYEEVGPAATPEQINRYLFQMADPRRPDAWPGWLTTMMFMICGGVGLWVAGLVCTVLGLRHRRNRRFAIVGLCLSCALPILIVVSSMANAGN